MIQLSFVRDSCLFHVRLLGFFAMVRRPCCPPLERTFFSCTCVRPVQSTGHDNCSVNVNTIPYLSAVVSAEYKHVQAAGHPEARLWITIYPWVSWALKLTAHSAEQSPLWRVTYPVTERIISQNGTVRPTAGFRTVFTVQWYKRADSTVAIAARYIYHA